jgi:hypothetical protein
VRTLKIIAIAAFAVTAVPLVTTVAGVGTAYAQTVRFETSNVAIGYNDGYWDHSHTWHNWQHSEDMAAYRASKNAEYHDWKHDRDKDMGWHEAH